jgi:GABA(A) receptor-associated protein
MLSVLNNFTHNNEKKKEQNEYINEYKYITEFRKKKLEDRIQICEKIKLKYKDSIPVIIDCKKDDINLTKNKYIVPLNLTISQFIYILRRKITIKPEQSIFLLCNNMLITSAESIKILYNNNKDYDGFLYIIVSLENAFGN